MALSSETIQKHSPILIGGVLFLVDRVFKRLALHDRIASFSNYDWVFGVPALPEIIVVVNVLILVAVLVLWHRHQHPALLFILIGGLSNLSDRFMYGSVIDYIFIIPFAPFNLADGLIVIGIVWYLWSEREKRKNLSS